MDSGQADTKGGCHNKKERPAGTENGSRAIGRCRARLGFKRRDGEFVQDIPQLGILSQRLGPKPVCIGRQWFSPLTKTVVGSNSPHGKQ
ncbi:MAG: hypothetical protein MI741_16725 [Rhodospirillales bacterium]|nr:hypothetical protein [Rhodospirillales bacterium]